MDAAKAGTIDGPGAWDGYAAVAVCEAGVQALRTGRKALVHLGDGGRISVEAEEEPEPDIHAPDLIGDRP